MASALPRAVFAAPPSLPAACSLNHTHDVHRLAQSIAGVAAPGTLLDIGCGSGSVSIPVLLARRDLRVVGVEVCAAVAAVAQDRAVQHRAADRFDVVVGDPLDTGLPHGRSVVSSPPMLPAEPWLPATMANLNGIDVRFADLPDEPGGLVLIRHSTVRLHRALRVPGDLR